MYAGYSCMRTPPKSTPAWKTGRVRLPEKLRRHRPELLGKVQGFFVVPVRRVEILVKMFIQAERGRRLAILGVPLAGHPRTAVMSVSVTDAPHVWFSPSRPDKKTVAARTSRLSCRWGPRPRRCFMLSLIGQPGPYFPRAHVRRHTVVRSGLASPRRGPLLFPQHLCRQNT